MLRENLPLSSCRQHDSHDPEEGVETMISAASFSARVFLSGAILSALAGSVTAQSAPTAAQSARYWRAVEDVLGRKGTVNPGGVLKFSFPRSDLRVVLNGVILQPALSLGSWLAFKRIVDHEM